MTSRSKEKDAKRSRSGHGKGFSRGEKIIGLVVLIFAIWVVYTLSQPPPPQATSQTSSAPNFTLPVVGPNGLTGQKLSLSSFRGKVVLLEFMEPWCPHCQNMEPTLESLQKQFGSQNVVILSVAGPWNGATADDTATFIRNYSSSWTYLYDSSTSTQDTWGVTSTPTFFIIGKDGSIITTLEGEQTYDTLAGLLAQASG